MISCIFPICEFTSTQDDPERAKREVIDHINHDHDDAHVICACAHDWREVERYVATTKTPDGKTAEFPQVKSQCARCDQFLVEPVESAGVVDGGEAADEVTISDIDEAPGANDLQGLNG